MSHLKPIQSTIFDLSRHVDEQVATLRDARNREWELEYKRKKRSEAWAGGLCMRCLTKPRMVQRTQCVDCQMNSLIQEAFKFDRGCQSEESKTTRKARTAARGTCYVDQFDPSVRKKWLIKIKSKWNGRCFYSGVPIEIGSTGSIDHVIPVCRAGVFGPSKVYHPDNLVWCHKGINNLKGQMTGEEFCAWLKNDLLNGLRMVGVL